MSDFALTTRHLASTETGHCTELLYDDGDNENALVCAAHGGGIEPGTAETALDLATGLDGVSCWARLGYDDESAFDAWHTPSTAIDPGDHPLLARIADRAFDGVLSLHGLSDEGVLVGGATDVGRKQRVADRLAAAVDVPVEVVDSGPYGGVSAENVANWLAADGGLQIEAGPSVRTDPADPVGTVLADLLRDRRR